MKCVNDQEEHSIWYQWSWCQERRRWERECAIMCCLAWQYANTAKIVGRVVARKAGRSHEHVWDVWHPVDEYWVEENLFYARRCACGAEERGENLQAEEPFLFFEHPRTKKA